MMLPSIAWDLWGLIKPLRLRCFSFYSTTQKANVFKRWKHGWLGNLNNLLQGFTVRFPYHNTVYWKHSQNLKESERKTNEQQMPTSSWSLEEAALAGGGRVSFLAWCSSHRSKPVVATVIRSSGELHHRVHIIPPEKQNEWEVNHRER